MHVSVFDQSYLHIFNWTRPKAKWEIFDWIWWEVTWKVKDESFVTCGKAVDCVATWDVSHSRLKVQDVATKEVLYLSKHLGMGKPAGAFSPDSSQFTLQVRGSQSFLIINLHSGDIIRQFHSSMPSLPFRVNPFSLKSAFQFSLNGKYIAWEFGGFDVTCGEEIRILYGGAWGDGVAFSVNGVFLAQNHGIKGLTSSRCSICQLEN